MVSAIRATPRHHPIDDRFATFIAERGAGSQLGGTNYGRMCESAAGFAYTSVRCRKCHGKGTRELDAEELDRWKRKITEASDVARGGRIRSPRDEMRAKLSEASTCDGCKGTGFVERFMRVGDCACASCGGDGVGLDGQLCGTCRGSGVGRRQRMDSLFTTVACGACGGSGRLRQRGNLHGCWALIHALGLDWCWTCDGRGWVIPVTVRETGSSKGGRLPAHSIDASTTSHETHGQAAEAVFQVEEWIDESAWVEFGEMSRVFDTLKATDPASAGVLDRYYSADGDRYGREPWGRIFAVWPLTHAGRQLAGEAKRRSKLGDDFNLTALERIAAERNREELSDVVDMRIRVLIKRADREARTMLDRALEALRKVGAQ